MGLPEDQLHPLASQPRDDRLRPVEPRRNQQRVVSTLLVTDNDVRLADRHLCGRIHEVAEQMSRIGLLVPTPNPPSQQAVQTAGHQRQLQVAIDLHRHRRAQGVHVEKVDAVLDAVLDDHPPGVALDQPGRRRRQLVGQEDRRLLMTQVGDRYLAERAVVIGQGDPPIEDARMRVLPRDPLQLDPSPRRRRRLVDLPHQTLRAAAQSDEVDPQAVELIELGVGRQLGIEDQLFGIPPRPFLPESGEVKDLVILVILAQFPVGIAEDASRGILHQESQDALLPPAPLGDVVLLDQGILAMEGNRVKIQVEGSPAGQPEPVHGIEPTAHQLRVAGRSDPAAVLRQVGSFGDDGVPIATEKKTTIFQASRSGNPWKSRKFKAFGRGDAIPRAPSSR